jgi:hypothetical protein
MKHRLRQIAKVGGPTIIAWEVGHHILEAVGVVVIWEWLF